MLGELEHLPVTPLIHSQPFLFTGCGQIASAAPRCHREANGAVSTRAGKRRYRYAYVDIDIYIYTGIHIYMCKHIHIYMYIYIYVCMNTYIYMALLLLEQVSDVIDMHTWI